MPRLAPHINKFLLPISCLYAMVVWFRNKLFDWNVLREQEFSIPVISVGNITVGGTGKTPHIEYLIRLLRTDFKVAMLSRGYKRKSKGFVLAGEQSTARDIGDEPYQVWRKFPDIIVAVDAKRVRGIRNLLALENNKRPDLILLDDAFQHRYVVPSLSILLVDINRLIYEDYLLPAGRLREPASNKSRAGMVIVTKCPPDLKPIDYRVICNHLTLFPYQSLFFTSWKYGALRGVFEACHLPEIRLSDLKKRQASILLLSGIAEPEQFVAALTPYASSIERMDYPDHYAFSSSDIARIKKRFERMPGDNKLVATTEKDVARLVNRQDIDEELKQVLYYLPIEVDFEQNNTEEFNQKIVEHVRTVKRNRFLD